MEDFVTFELAVKLKEKGFPQDPDYFNYSNYYDWDDLRKIHSLSNASVWFDSNMSRNNLYFAPTIYQVLKWLRKEKQVDILIDILIKYDNNLNRKRQYTAKILTSKLNKPIYVCSIYNYEKALIRAIKYYLDNLI